VERRQILDEFVSVTGYHRKHEISLLGGSQRLRSGGAGEPRRLYREAEHSALIVLWEEADRICGKRLKAALPSLVEAMERHGHLRLESTVRERLLATVTLSRSPARFGTSGTGQQFGKLSRRSFKKRLGPQFDNSDSNIESSFRLHCDDEYATKLTGLAFQNHNDSYRGHIFTTSNFSAFRIHSRPWQNLNLHSVK